MSVTTVVEADFSEPVQNVTGATFKLFKVDPQGQEEVPADVYVRVVDGRMTATLQPKRNLEYGQIYVAALSQEITDQQPNPSAGGQLLPLDQAYSHEFTTQVPQGYDLAADQQFGNGWDVALYSDNLTDPPQNYAYVTAKETGLRRSTCPIPPSRPWSSTNSPPSPPPGRCAG